MCLFHGWSCWRRCVCWWQSRAGRHLARQRGGSLRTHLASTPRDTRPFKIAWPLPRRAARNPKHPSATMISRLQAEPCGTPWRGYVRDRAPRQESTPLGRAYASRSCTRCHRPPSANSSPASVARCTAKCRESSWRRSCPTTGLSNSRPSPASSTSARHWPPTCRSATRRARLPRTLRHPEDPARSSGRKSTRPTPTTGTPRGTRGQG